MQVKNNKGFTIAELLISLAITAMLLVAAAAAFNASVTSYQENEKIFKSMNSARQALVRITTQLRTADGNSVSVPNSNECSFTTAEPRNITYSYDSGAKILNLETNGTDYVLCDNVTAMNFTHTLNTEGKVKSVQITMTVGIGDVSQTVSSAAVIRKNLK